MATYYVDPVNGNDADDGLSWADAFLTLNGAEDEPVAAGDVVHVGPGVYRELLTIDISGGNTYSTGTVTVTNASKTVTGSGTTFTGSVYADGMFHVRFAATGSDGVANASATFTSAAGNFQSSMIGMIIQIGARAPYRISAVASATSITLADPLAVGWPASGSSLSYSVMSGQGAYEIESVDSNTQLTLKQAWAGPTMSGLAYLCWQDIKFLADVTGENTDGIGGIVRITGSDNDQTITRTRGIYAVDRDYRTFRGFHIDSCGTGGPHGGIVINSGSIGWVIEDCTVFHVGSDPCISIYENDVPCFATIRRCMIGDAGLYDAGIFFNEATDIDDDGTVIESCVIYTCEHGVRAHNTGGITVKNCVIFGQHNTGVYQATAASAGQATVVANNVIHDCTTALTGTVAVAEIVEDYNGIWGCNADRNNVAVGANSVTHIPLFLMPLLVPGFKFSPPLIGQLSEWSAYRRLSSWSVYASPGGDLHGIPRPITSSKNSWGAMQFVDAEVESGTVQAGTYSRALHDAGQVLVRRIPVTGVEITVTLYMRFEADYEPDPASLPRMIIKQPGQADQITTMTAAANNWEQLSDTFTPASLPGFVDVYVESLNTATSGSYDVFYDTMG